MYKSVSSFHAGGWKGAVCCITMHLLKVQEEGVLPSSFCNCQVFKWCQMQAKCFVKYSVILIISGHQLTPQRVTVQAERFAQAFSPYDNDAM